jgi:hypothetical protein
MAADDRFLLGRKVTSPKSTTQYENYFRYESAIFEDVLRSLIRTLRIYILSMPFE